MNQADPCLEEAWPRMFNKDERRGNLNLLVKAILSKDDELTAMHKAERLPDAVSGAGEP
jgi:hypothetical protein